MSTDLRAVLITRRSERRFVPRLDWVDGVPTVLLVVPQAAVEGYPSADARR
jgi:hypothetical protein